MFVLDYRDARPIYTQICDSIKSQICSGILQEGDRLPSVRELAVELTINPNTIQRSYAILESEGWIASVPGKGSFVCPLPQTARNQAAALWAELEDLRQKFSHLGISTEEIVKHLTEGEEQKMLEIKNVTKTFGNVKALDDLTMHIPKGAIYGLVGPNGAGKSTAIRHLVGVYRQDTGDVLMEGTPIYENPALKMRIGYIPDEIFFFPSASLEEMRRYYRDVYPTFDNELFENLQGIFNLPRKGQLRRFSKGMQKQAAFQLTLCIRPDVLILDEPVDGLDPVMRRQVWNLILSEVAQKGTTVLISSHNLRELEDICDHVGIMDHGKMLLERSLADMQGNILKLQMVGDVPENLEVLHESQSGRLRTLIVRGNMAQVESILQNENPAYYDLLPLSLEEIFIYELGGVNYEVKNIVL